MKIEIRKPTLLEFIDIYKLAGSIEDKEHIVKLMTNVEDTNSLSIEEFGQIINECYAILNDIDPKLQFTINNTKYIVNPDWNSWNFRQWVDIDVFIQRFKDEPLMAAPYIAYILSCEYTNEHARMTDKVGENWLNEDFDKFISIYNFFLQKEKSLQVLGNHYLMVNQMVKQQVQDIQTLPGNGHGLSHLRTYLMQITQSRISSLIYPSQKSLTISVSKLIKAMLKDLKWHMKNKLTRVKTSLSKIWK